MKHTRRGFLKIATAAAAGTTGSMPVLSGLFAAETPVKKASKYIDFHTHIGTTWNGNKELTPDGLLRWMDDHDIEKSVLLPLTSPESSSFLLLTEPALKAAKDHPDRFIPFCSVDPRTSLRGGRKGFLDVIGRYVEMGAKGFGEHKVGLNFDDPLMMQIYDVCQELKIPLLFHMDNQRGKDTPGLPRLEHAISTFPKLNFIGHGPGWWASISGGLTQQELAGYPTGKVRAGGAIDRLMEKYPNIYGDLSAGSGANSISRDSEFGRAFMIRRQDRLMFGTDYLQPGQKVPQFEVFDSLGLPKETAGKIFCGNAERVLGLKD
jgi:predicted TIM-barrel fold metal-dependent hydrolase